MRTTRPLFYLNEIGLSLFFSCNKYLSYARSLLECPGPVHSFNRPRYVMFAFNALSWSAFGIYVGLWLLCTAILVAFMAARGRPTREERDQMRALPAQDNSPDQS